MAEAYKILGQAALAAATLTDVYTVPASTSVVVSSIVLANRSATPTTARVSVAIAGAADTNAQYVVYDVVLDGNQSVTLVLGITLATTDKVRAYAAAATVSINVFGTELTGLAGPGPVPATDSSFSEPINGGNTDFTMSFPFVSGSTKVYLNGLRQIIPDDYDELDTDTIQFVAAPLTGDRIIVDYLRS